MKSLLNNLVGATSILVLAFSSIAALIPFQTVYADYPNGDCDANAVIRCGVNSVGELKDDYNTNQGGNVDDVFRFFGMSSAASFDGMVMGKVTKSGEVWVGSQKVATDAVTAGRHNMPGSTAILNGQFYQRPPSVSFRSDSLEALVKMDDGNFKYAVIMSCGNPVKAKPVEQPKPQPKPQPTPQNPNLSIEKDVRIAGETDWSDRISADLGDDVQYRITIKNTGDTDLTDVRIHDSLPSGVSFESSALDGSENILDFEIGDLVGEGFTLDRLAKGGLIEIRFTVTVGDNFDEFDTSVDIDSDNDSSQNDDDSSDDSSGGMSFENNRPDEDTDNDDTDTQSGDNSRECAELRNVARARAEGVSEKEDDAFVEVCQDVVEEQPQVKAKQSPPAKELPDTGAAGAIGIFSVTSILGWAAYKLKEFYSIILR